MARCETHLCSEIEAAVIAGIPEKWKNKYQFLQMAAKEKIERERLFFNNELKYIHFQCIYCAREIYVKPDVAGMFEYIWCTVCAKSEKKDAMHRIDIVTKSKVPAGATVREK